MDLIYFVVLIVAGILAGFVNTIAGGGSVITLPALMLLGMPADIANGTNRVGVAIQSLAAMREFSRHGRLDGPAILPVLAPTMGGSLLGALTASWIPVVLLKPLLLGTMMAMTVLMLVKPQFIPPDDSVPFSLSERPWAGLWLFLSGVYGGFVQAGVGFLLIATLAGVLRYDLARANALKMTCTAVFGCVALAVFTWRGQVDWVPGLVCGLATIIGVRLSVRYALKVQPETMKKWLVGMALVVCAAALLK